MTLIAVEFPDDPSKFAKIMRDGAELQVAKVLFNTRIWVLDQRILIIDKIFVPRKTMNFLYLLLLIGSSIPWLVWGVRIPLYIVTSLILIFYLFDTQGFNFLMLRIMLKKHGYSQKVRLL